MTEDFTFSVVIPTYNRKTRLGRCLESVAGNNLASCEVVVVDDGSSDGTGSFLAEKYPCVKYVYQENQGVSTARNTGMKEACGQFIAFLDSDDLWYPSRLDILAKVAAVLPDDVALIFNDMDMLDGGKGSGVSFSDQYFGVKRVPLVQAMDEECQADVGDDVLRVRFGRVFDVLLQGNIIQPSCAILRRSVFGAEGGFREDFRVANDSEYFLRVAKKYKVAYVPKILTTLDPPNSADSLSNRKNSIEKISNMIVAIREHMEEGTEPNVSFLLKKRLANLQALRGYHHLSDLHTTKARQGYQEAWAAYPFKPKYYLMWCIALLPSFVLAGLGNLKRILRKARGNG